MPPQATPLMPSSSPTPPGVQPGPNTMRPLDGASVPRARLDISRIDPTMTHTVALSPPRAVFEPISASSSADPSPSNSPPASLRGFGSEPVSYASHDADDADLKAPRLSQATSRPHLRRLAEPAIAATVGSLIPALGGATTYLLFDGLQTLTQTETCNGCAVNLPACIIGMFAGTLATGLGWHEAAQQGTIEQLSCSVACISATSTLGAELYTSLAAAMWQARSTDCFLPVTFRSVGSTATVLAFGMQSMQTSPERLYDAARCAAAPLVLAGQATSFVARRVWRRRWH